MKNPITRIQIQSRLFKQTHKIGDTIEHDSIPHLVLGIEGFRLYGHELTVWYTCQDLSVTGFFSMKNAIKEPNQAELEVKVKFDNSSIFKRIALGSTHWVHGNVYKLTEYTAIKIVGTDIHIDMLARPVHPVESKHAKAILHSERRKKLSLELV